MVGKRERLFKVCFYFSLSCSHFESVLLELGEGSLTQTLSETYEYFVIFSLFSPVSEGSDRVTLVRAWCPARVNTPQ